MLNTRFLFYVQNLNQVKKIMPLEEFYVAHLDKAKFFFILNAKSIYFLYSFSLFLLFFYSFYTPFNNWLFTKLVDAYFKNQFTPINSINRSCS